MAEAATTFLLQSLKEEISHNIQLSRDAKTELEALQKDLEEMKNELEKASRKKSGDGFRECETKILDVIYEAEDLIDSYITQEQYSSRRWRFNAGKINLVAKMKELRGGKLKTIFGEAKRELAALPTDENNDKLEKRKKFDPMTEKKVVGMEDEIEKYIKALLKPSTKVEASSVVGMPGLGKTTVASKVFRDDAISHHFPTRAWINVSQDHNKKDIYLSILKSFTENDMSNLPETELARMAKDRLSKVKFLLVFDDVWTTDAWKDIKEALPLEGGSGKVLITTRFDQVANHVNPTREEKDLRFLEPEESWTLLQHQVYGEVNKWPRELELLGRKICEKSGGLPLAIVVIGGILLDKIFPEDKREAEWKKIAATAETFILKDKKEEGLNSIIGLSYDTMPYDLRDCFLYMGICPKDFEMSTWKLKRLWIAEGFIKQEENSSGSLEDIAEDKLMDLIRRNLVMVGKKNDRGDVKTCRVHDMIREFCKEKAKNLLTVISKTEEGHFKPEISKLKKFRRICVHSHVLEFLKEKLDGPNLRSFISFSKTVIDAEGTTLQSIAEAFKLLRIFEGSSLKFSRFETKLARLYHLRYITLAVGDNFKCLPSKITDLLNLQTLVIVSSHREFEIKADISVMPRLRHVKSNAALILDKIHGSNKNLLTLSRLSAQSCTEEMMTKSIYLQRLCISGKIAALPCFSKHLSLKKLKLINVVSSETPITHLLDESKFPPNLEILVLSATNLIWSYMSVLGRLKNLQVLKIKDNAFNGDEWKVGHGEFVNLRYLEIERSDLLSWTVAAGSFGRISSLCIHNCPKLLDIPPVVAESLKTLHLGNVGRNAVFSGVAIQQKREINLKLDPGTYVPQ